MCTIQQLRLEKPVGKTYHCILYQVCDALGARAVVPIVASA